MLLYFLFTDTATTEIYTLSLHDALPISDGTATGHHVVGTTENRRGVHIRLQEQVLAAFSRHDASTCSCRRDRKSTRLNSSHVKISYAVFCLKKKTKYK